MKNKINIVTIDSDGYPEKLKHYKDMPKKLYYIGNLPDSSKPTVAMVGARACSNYGRKNAFDIAKDLSNHGVQVISGMARGIDTYSALGALEGKTPTFAVLGNGVDICYPTENIELYSDIIDKGGGIISEYEPGEKARSWNFPRRNRLISAFSDIVVPIEAKNKSGSLITVEWALEQGKDVMALPGRVGDLLSEGCNRLIKSGAGLVMDYRDILQELNIETDNVIKDKKGNKKFENEQMDRLYACLDSTPITMQKLIEKSQMSYESVCENILKLQLQDAVSEPMKGYYTKK